MSVDGVRKKIGMDSAHSAQGAPMARLRARFGFPNDAPALAPAPPPRVSAVPERLEPPPEVSPWDLPPDLYERWEERVCIMHYDGRLPWKQAEALALADVLGQAGPAGKCQAGPTLEAAKVEQPAPVIQTTLFASEKGPY